MSRRNLLSLFAVAVIIAGVALWTISRRGYQEIEPPGRVVVAGPSGAVIEGRVVGSAGHGLGGIPVDTRYFSSLNRNAEAVESTFTDPQGYFEIASHGPAFVNMNIAPLRDLAPERLDFRLEKNESLEDVLIVLTAGATVQGRLTWQDEIDWTGATVHGHYRDSPHGGRSGHVEVAADGSYTYEHLPTREVQLQAQHPELGTIEKTVELEERIHTIDFNFEESLWLSGNIVDSEGQPITGELKSAITVTLTYPETARSSSQYNNRFSFPIFESGTYTLKVEREGYLPYETVVEITGSPISDLRVVLSRARE